MTVDDVVVSKRSLFESEIQVTPIFRLSCYSRADGLTEVEVFR